MLGGDLPTSAPLSPPPSSTPSLDRARSGPPHATKKRPSSNYSGVLKRFGTARYLQYIVPCPPRCSHHSAPWGPKLSNIGRTWRNSGLNGSISDNCRQELINIGRCCEQNARQPWPRVLMHAQRGCTTQACASVDAALHPLALHSASPRKSTPRAPVRIRALSAQFRTFICARLWRKYGPPAWRDETDAPEICDIQDLCRPPPLSDKDIGEGRKPVGCHAGQRPGHKPGHQRGHQRSHNRDTGGSSRDTCRDTIMNATGRRSVPSQSPGPLAQRTQLGTQSTMWRTPAFRDKFSVWKKHTSPSVRTYE